jgi:arylsulfatase A
VPRPAPQSENIGKPKAPEKEPFVPKLYNLDTDIGETTDVADKHPDVVRRLQESVAAMDADLGATKQGPGVRPPGRVKDPLPLLLKEGR